MTFTDEQKAEIFQQINRFNSQNSDPSLANSKPYSEAYFYVNEATAKDRSSFVEYLLKNNLIDNPTNVIDLAFGSGNLTAHLLLDNDIYPECVVFNDKNNQKTNQSISLGNSSKITQYDFLKSLPFSERFDWVVFNPQIGGGYIDGDSKLEQSIKVITSSESLTNYLSGLNIGIEFTVDVDESNKIITVKSSSANKSQMQSIHKEVRVWNYYDVFIHAANSQSEGTETNVVKFRKNLDAIVSNEHIIIFLGEEKHFKALFADYPHVYRYMTGGKDLFVASKQGEAKTVCYERKGDTFEENPHCKIINQNNTDLGSLEEVFNGLTDSIKDFTEHSLHNPFGSSYLQEWQNTPTLTMNESPSPEFDSDSKAQSKNIISDLTQKGSCDFAYKNILLKGVPGTGKSRLLELIIEQKLNLKKEDWDKHVLRVNIHSASSNADLMQGIAVSTNNGSIAYSEKRGLIFDLICRACQYPNQPFVLILEEIQENSLNQLIGDLIYLIEDGKRAKLSTVAHSLTGKECLDLVEAYVMALSDVHYVKIPNLVSLGEYRKMILPNNLYIFCTSNYRDDKKIIEDNLLRRFEVIDLYPRPVAINNPVIRDFLGKLNNIIVSVLKDEIHPDRFQIGHASWLDVNNEISFARALYKTLIELKEVREIQPADLKKIFHELKEYYPVNDNQQHEWLSQVLDKLTPENPVTMIHSFQEIAYKDLITLINDFETNKDSSEVSE